MTAKTEDEVHSTMGPYHVLRRIGGGRGDCFLARDERLDRLVAIKRIGPGDHRDRRRLRREARLVAQLNHPAVVQIYDVIEEDEHDAIVMEYVEGRNLRSWLDGRPLTWDRTVALGEQIALGLDEAHRKNIIHRDLRTENVRITEAGQAKISDFGLGRRLFPEGEATASETAERLGAACRAMSPEQIQGEQLTPLSDVFSLGALLYEVATGTPPFGEGDLLTLQNIVKTTQVPAMEVCPKVPAGLSLLIDELLLKDRFRRPQSAEEIAERLRALLPRPSTAEPTGSGSIPRPLWRPASRPGGSGSGPSSDSSLDISLKTLVLTDLVESTGLIDQIGDTRANEMFIRHDRLARDLLARHEGREIDKSDGFLLLFDRPRDAVYWALAYHQDLHRLSRETGVTITARVGIHVGEIYLHENQPEDVVRGAKPLEIEGLAKPTAARVMSLAVGGQTLLTQAAFEVVRRALDDPVGRRLRWVDHGIYDCKGIQEPVRIFEVGDPEHAPFTAPRDTGKVRHVRRRLPAVGALVLLLLLGGWHYLRQVAADVQGRDAVAVLGFKDLSGGPGSAWLSTALAELLSSELAAGGQLRLIPGESVARMKLDLSLIETDALSPDTLEAIRRNLGTEYVVLGWYLLIDRNGERRLSIQPVLQSTATGETTVGSRSTGREDELQEVVTRAAANLRAILGVEELSRPQLEAVEAILPADSVASRLYFEGLEKLRRHDALAARDVLRRAVTADPGHALSHAALSQAWSALGHEKKAATSARRAFELRRGLPREEVLQIEGRYYAASHQSEEAIRSYQTLWGFYPDHLDYGLLLARTQDDAGHMREALETLSALRQLAEPSGSDPRIDLAEAQVAFSVADYPRELALAEKALQRGKEQNARLLMAEALFRKGRTSSMLGELDEAAAALEASRRLFVEVGDRVSAVRAMNAYAVQLWEQGEPARADEIFHEALALLEGTGNKRWLSTLLNNRATLILERGDLERAERMLRESLQLVLEIRDLERQAERLANLAWVALEKGDPATARVLAGDALTIADAIGSRQKQGEIAHLSGRIALAGGRWHQARELAERALAIFEDLGARRFLAQAQHLLAEVFLAGGAEDEALRRLEQAAAIRVELREHGHLARTRLSRATVLLELGRATEAAALARAAAAELARAERADDELLAGAVLARALIADGRRADARELTEDLAKRSGKSQSPGVRLRVAIAVAEVEADGGDHRAARRRLSKARDEATRHGLVGVALKARLALGHLEPSELEALAADARRHGFVLLAEKATAVRGSPQGDDT